MRLPFLLNLGLQVSKHLGFVSLGQFMQEPKIHIFNERPGKDAEKPEASMEVKGQKLTVTR
jgi:hypothetical protein